ncbi:MAG: hypothetical protein NUW01_06760 [Gemmatimonadaceae bacterium]|nr:hypothetical protein [Gemmatimonadaceae bacterium]
MNSKATSLRAWEPTPQQRYAAQLLAAGATWDYTSDKVQVNNATIARWLKLAGFHDLQARYESLIERTLTRQIEAGMEEMLSLWREMILGKVPARDKRLDRIQPIVTKYFERAFTVEDASDNGARGAPPLAQQFNIYPGQPPTP